MPFVNQHHESSISQHMQHFGISGVPTATQQSISASTFVHHAPQTFVNQHHDSSISQHMHQFGVAGVPTNTQQSVSASSFVRHVPQPFVDLYAAPDSGEAGLHKSKLAFIPGWTRKAGHQAPGGGQSAHVVGSALKEDFLGGRKRHEYDSSRSGVEYELQKDERKHLANGPREERLRDLRSYSPINPAGCDGCDSWGLSNTSASAVQPHTTRINAAMAQQSAIYNREMALQAQRARIGELRMNRICNDGLVYSKRINGTVRDSLNWESNEHRVGH